MTTQNYNTLVRFGITESIVNTVMAAGDASLEPGRVVAATRGTVLAQATDGEVWCSISGAAWAEIEESCAHPCAGDWVLFRRYKDGSGASLERVLPRSSVLERHAAGRESRGQALAANIDYVFLVMGLDGNFKPARMERFVAVAWGSGAQPVVLLNKADLVDDPAAYVYRIEGVAPGVPVHAVSATDGSGVEAVRSYLTVGTTAVLLGSSGVGKSTLLNTLAGEELRKTTSVREADSRGRHTTSLRELFHIQGAGCLIDSPGVREVGLWGDESILEDTFSDIAELASECRFSDCAHQSEPGCAVKAALESGNLPYERYESYLKLRKELDFVASRTDERLQRERRARGKSLARYARSVQKRKHRHRR